MTYAEALRRLDILVDLLPPDLPNVPGRPMIPTHVTIHNTGNPKAGADALAHARYLRGADAARRKVSWHFTVDDRRTVKHLRTREQGWHAGTRAGNRCSIGIEICEHRGIDQAAANERAALLTAVLMHVLRIPVEHVVPHRHWSGKHCPHLLLREGAWASFIRRTAELAHLITTC